MSEKLTKAITDVIGQPRAPVFPPGTVHTLVNKCVNGGPIRSDMSVEGDPEATLTASSVMLVKCEYVMRQTCSLL